jgi:hypothetical protein
VFAEVFFGGEEVVVFEDLDFGAEVLKGLFHSVFAWLDYSYADGLQAFEGAAEFGAQRGGLWVYFAIFDGPPGIAEFVSKVTHGAEEYGDSGFVARDVSGFLANLGHPDSIMGRIGSGEERGFAIELISEDDEQMADSHGRWDAGGGQAAT